MKRRARRVVTRRREAREIHAGEGVAVQEAEAEGEGGVSEVEIAIACVARADSGKRGSEAQREGAN